MCGIALSAVTFPEEARAMSGYGEATWFRVRHIWTILKFTVVPAVLAIAALAAVQVISGRPLTAVVSGQVLSVDPPVARVCARVDEVVHYEFRIRNVSGQSLKVLGFNSDCGCAIATNSFPISLSAGEATQIRLKVTVGKPGPNGKFVRNPILLVNREGTVPPLVLEAVVVGSADAM